MYNDFMKYKTYADGLNKRIGIRLTDYEYKRLKQAAKKSKMTMSNFVRQLIEVVVENLNEDQIRMRNQQ